MKLNTILTLAALAVTVSFQTPIMRAGDQGPQRITFEKCFVPDAGPFGGHFVGTVEGDCGAGTVVFNYVSVSPGKAIWHFSGEYAVETPECSFTAFCEGTVDVRTGHIVLNGVITVGEHLGARVQVRAQRDETLPCSAGTMTITPGRQN